MKRLVMLLTACFAATLLNAQNLLVPAFVDHNDNNHKFEMTDTGWNTKGFWLGGGNALTNKTESWAVGALNYCVVQTITITNSCSEMEFSFDWTPAATIQSNASLTLSYQVFGWTTNTPFSAGDIIVNGINWPGNEIADSNLDCEAYDFLGNRVAAAGAPGKAKPTVFSVTGVAGVTTNVTHTLSTLIALNDNLDDYDYLGVRFYIDSNGDAGNVGSTIENIALTPLDTVGPSVLVYDDFDYGQTTAVTSYVGSALEPDIAPAGAVWSGVISIGAGSKWADATTNGYARFGSQWKGHGASASLPVTNADDYAYADLSFKLQDMNFGADGMIGFSGPLAVSGVDGVWGNATSDGLYIGFSRYANWKEDVVELRQAMRGTTGLYYGTNSNPLVCFTNVLGNAAGSYIGHSWSMKVDFIGKTVSVYRDGSAVVADYVLPSGFSAADTFDSVTMASEYFQYESADKSVYFDDLVVFATLDTEPPPAPKGTVILLK